MALKIGSNDIDTVYVGSTSIDKIYQGSQLIWHKPKKYTVHFKQLIKNSLTNRTSAISYTHNSDDSVTVSGTSTNSNDFRNFNYNGGNACSIVIGHKYAFYTTIVSLGENYTLVPFARIEYYNTNGGEWAVSTISNPIFTITNLRETDTITWARVQGANSTGAVVDCTLFTMLFDLTEMFSDCEEIMPTTVDEFKALFPNQYYAYTDDYYDVEIEV